MRWLAKESQCTDGRVWIVCDLDHPWEYQGPFGTKRQADAFARPGNKANWIALLKAEREKRKAREV
jgi:hypothetical protein